MMVKAPLLGLIDTGLRFLDEGQVGCGADCVGRDPLALDVVDGFDRPVLPDDEGLIVLAGQAILDDVGYRADVVLGFGDRQS